MANGELLKRTHATIPCLPGLQLPGPLSPQQDPADRASTGAPLTLTGRFGSASSGDHWGPGAHKFYFYLPRVSVSPSHVEALQSNLALLLCYKLPSLVLKEEINNNKEKKERKFRKK